MITINPVGAVLGMTIVGLTVMLFLHLAHKPEHKKQTKKIDKH